MCFIKYDKLLGSNNINSESATCFAEALKVNRTLQILDLSIFH